MSLLKSNPLIYIYLKSKGNVRDISKNKKAFQTIKKLDLINDVEYLKVHPDCLKEDMDVNLHYIYYGHMDDLDIKKSYVDSFFDLDFYMDAYGCDDPILDYVFNGFDKGNKINESDNNYIKSLDESLSKQFVGNYVEDHDFITDEKVLISYIESNNEFKTDKIRIGVFAKDSFDEIPVCPYIRIYAPFKELAKSGKYKFFLYGENTFTKMDLANIINVKQFDIIVVQRIIPFLHIIQNRAFEHGIGLIYETDDDLLGVEENSPSFNYIEKYRSYLTNFIDNVDIITVTTPLLASKFQNNNVEIIRNYLNFPEIAEDIKNNDGIKLGYCGTLTHSKDLFLIKDVIIELKNKMKDKYNMDIDFEIIGGFNEDDEDKGDWYTSVELPNFCNDFEKFRNWFKDYAKWDIGIVPLENSDFNKSKSELKYIDLTAIGVPGVYSDMEVYNGVIKEGVNGLLASSKEEWIEKLEKLILDKELRKTIFDNAKKDILDNYTLESRVQQWDSILSSL